MVIHAFVLNKSVPCTQCYVKETVIVRDPDVLAYLFQQTA